MVQLAPFSLRKCLFATSVLLGPAIGIQERLVLRPACNLLISRLQLSNPFCLNSRDLNSVKNMTVMLNIASQQGVD